MSTGRNESCPCGSGKKYKNCCLGGDGIETERRQRLTWIAVAIVAGLAILSGVIFSQGMGITVAALGLAAIGAWLWLTDKPPASGSGSDPSAINFGR